MRYAYREENVDYVADLTFDALSYEEIHDKKLSRRPSRVRLGLRQRRADFAKIIELGDVSVPGAPWFNARIMALMDETLFVGVDDGLLLIDAATASILKRIRTGNTEVSEIVPDFDRRRVYVVNEPYGFVAEDNASNVAAYEHNGRLAWRAPMAVEEWSDAKGYSQIIALDQAVLEVTTWTGRCHVDAEDGRVVNCWFTKGM